MLTVVAMIHEQANGLVTVSNPDGTVVSIQPDGSEDTRPKGTAGAYECARREGLLLFYQPEVPGPTYVRCLPVPQK